MSLRHSESRLQSAAEREAAKLDIDALLTGFGGKRESVSL